MLSYDLGNRLGPPFSGMISNFSQKPRNLGLVQKFANHTGLALPGFITIPMMCHPFEHYKRFHIIPIPNEPPLRLMLKIHIFSVFSSSDSRRLILAIDDKRWRAPGAESFAVIGRPAAAASASATGATGPGAAETLRGRVCVTCTEAEIF